MTDSRHKEADPIHLIAEEGNRAVVISEDQDRFLRTCQWAVEACKLGLSREVLVRELNSLFAHVGLWARANADRVSKCFASPRDDQLAIYVVPRSNSFDFELNSKLTSLDFELAEKFQACPCDVLQVPSATAEPIESAREHPAIQLYGDQESASEPVGA